MANIINHHRCQHSFIFMYHEDIPEYLFKSKASADLNHRY